MRIFVGYSFKDNWVEEYVIPLIQSYGAHVDHGKELPGLHIDDGIKKLIDGANAVIIFLTCYKPLQDPGKFQPGDWVVQELTYADAVKIPRILEVRESAVEFVGALHGNVQRYTVDPEDLAPFLVQLGRAVSSWRGAGEIKLQLVSDEFSKSIKTLLKEKQYQCSYQVRRGATLIEEVKDVEIVRERYGLFVYTKTVPADVLISVTVSCKNGTWTSPGIAVAVLEVLMEKD